MTKRSAKDSAKRFAELLSALAKNSGEDGISFEDLIPTIYDGKVLSNVDQDKDCLEGRFLRWLVLQ